MKLETLNIWGGQIVEPLLKHIKEVRDDVDIFCLQEVFNGRSSPKAFPKAIVDIYSQIDEKLPEHQGYFAISQNMGLATFLRKSIQVTEVEDKFVHRWKGAMINDDPSTMGRNIQYIQLEQNGKLFTIVNFHGLWNGRGKTDTPDRIEQSQKVKAFLDSVQGAKILCGDFNLLPDTESIAILEQGMRNLITEHGVTSTRSEFYTKPGKLADYILVSPEIQVRDFKVLQEPVSDHLPLQLEFS